MWIVNEEKCDKGHDWISLWNGDSSVVFTLFQKGFGDKLKVENGCKGMNW